jgi:hypothetical protein
MNSWAIERLLLCETSSGFWKPSTELLNFDVPHDNYEQQSWICPNKIFFMMRRTRNLQGGKKLHAREARHKDDTLN